MILKKPQAIFFICLFAFVLYSPFNSMSQSVESTWNYPVHMGTEEWKQLNSFSERLNAFNIPDDILKQMTTESLVNTCLKYPWWILITSRDNNQAGYDYLNSVFNGFRELEQRKDAGKELLKKYEKMMPEDIYNHNSLVEQGVFSFKFTYIELLLSQPDILKNIEDESLLSLAQKASSVYNAKSEAFDKYSYYGIATSCLILSRTLKLKKYHAFELLGNKFPELMVFNNRGNSGNKELLDLIYNAATSLF